MTSSPTAIRHEHPLLGAPRRDVITTVLLSLLTAVMFVLVALHTTGAAIQRVDDRFLKFMVENRSSSATAVAKVLNILGLVYVTLPARVAVAVFLAVRRRWWHLAAFVGAVVLSEVCIGPIKALYARLRSSTPAGRRSLPGMPWRRRSRWSGP